MGEMISRLGINFWRVSRSRYAGSKWAFVNVRSFSTFAALNLGLGRYRGIIVWKKS